MTTYWDGPWRLTEYDPLTGRTIWLMHNADGTSVMRVDYPIDALLRENAIARAESAGKRNGDWVRIAQLPLNVHYASGLAEAIDQGDRKFISKVLNDGDNRAWRTKESKV